MLEMYRETLQCLESALQDHSRKIEHRTQSIPSHWELISGVTVEARCEISGGSGDGGQPGSLCGSSPRRPEGTDDAAKSDVILQEKLAGILEGLVVLTEVVQIGSRSVQRQKKRVFRSVHTQESTGERERVTNWQQELLVVR